VRYPSTVKYSAPSPSASQAVSAFLGEQQALSATETVTETSNSGSGTGSGTRIWSGRFPSGQFLSIHRTLDNPTHPTTHPSKVHIRSFQPKRRTQCDSRTKVNRTGDQTITIIGRGKTLFACDG